MTANLQPLKKPGSKPKTILPFNGACKSNFSKFIEKISIDLFCALSLNSERISRSIDGNNKRSQPSTTASYKTSSTIVVWPLSSVFNAFFFNCSSSNTKETVITFSFSARSIAMIRWSASWEIFSLRS